jgi:hypothetical protein
MKLFITHQFARLQVTATGWALIQRGSEWISRDQKYWVGKAGYLYYRRAAS